MAEYEKNKISSDEWYTPKSIFDALGMKFDLDPCYPAPMVCRPLCHVPCYSTYTKQDDGLSHEWLGCVFMNPPFGGRNSHVPWLKRFIEHGNGIAIVRAYTSAKWFHDWAIKADGMLFPKGKTKFVRPDGTIGNQPGHGIVILAMGTYSCTALRDSKLGYYIGQ